MGDRSNLYSVEDLKRRALNEHAAIQALLDSMESTEKIDSFLSKPNVDMLTVSQKANLIELQNEYLCLHRRIRIALKQEFGFDVSE